MIRSEFLFDKCRSDMKMIFFLHGQLLHGHFLLILGLTVGPNIDYVLVKTFNPYTHLPVNVILAKALVQKYFKAEGENGILKIIKKAINLFHGKFLSEFKGKDLEGMSYTNNCFLPKQIH